MSGEKKSVNKELKLALISLANLAASKHSSVFNIGKGSEQVLALLQWAAKSDDVKVNQLFLGVGQYVSSAHKRFFESNGVIFSPLPEAKPKTVSVTYRGQSVSKDVAPKESSLNGGNIAKEGTSKKGKRKITYRGQEKWV